MDEELAFIALGSNLGDARQNIERAIEALQKLTDAPLRRSSLRVTAPIDCPPGSPDFVNAIVALRPRTSETPSALLVKLQEIEKEFGRHTKRSRNEPRPLDLDLIAFGNQVVTSPELTLPHPRARLRRFVLEPMVEIAPNFILPGQTKTAAQLLAESA